MNIPDDLKELRANVDSLVKKYQEVKAMPPEDHSGTKEMEDMVFRMAQYMHERISRVEDNFYEWAAVHMKNHLPNPATAADMQKALEGLGLDKNFEVVKPKIIVAKAKDKYGFNTLDI